MKIGITGHRFLGDAATCQAIRKNLEAVLGEHARAGDIGLSGMAIGADQMFAELALAAGLRLHAVIASDGHETTFAVGDERSAYDALLAKASEVTTMPFPTPSEAAFEAAGRWIVDHCDVLIAVWNGKPARGRGGTGDIVEYARGRSVKVVAVPVL